MTRQIMALQRSSFCDFSLILILLGTAAVITHSAASEVPQREERSEVFPFNCRGCRKIGYDWVCHLCRGRFPLDYGLRQGDGTAELNASSTMPMQHTHHLPVEGIATIDLDDTADVESIHLTMDDGNELFAKVEHITRKANPSPQAHDMSPAAAEDIKPQGKTTTVGLSGGYTMKLSLDEMTLMDKDGNLMMQYFINVSPVSDFAPAEPTEAATSENATFLPTAQHSNRRLGVSPTPADRERRNLAVASCHSGGCGSVKVKSFKPSNSPARCGYNTGLYGNYSSCNTPAVVATNYQSPVLSSLPSYQPFGNIVDPAFAGFGGRLFI